MATFGQLTLTNLGFQAQINAQSGTPLKFSKIGVGSGLFTGDISTLTSLVKEELLVGIEKSYIEENVFTVEGSFSNESLESSFVWREIGLYFEDENGGDILYCYANAGNRYDDIPATTDERYTKNIRIATAVSNAENVSIVIKDETYVKTETYEAFTKEVDKHISNVENPHKVTASQVGLGNVPNVATNDQAPTYTEASANAALSSGEKLSVAFGKIAKAINSLISHLADNVVHITSAERTKWDGKLDATATAVNADKLDGLHATDFLTANGTITRFNPVNDLNNFYTGIGLFNESTFNMPSKKWWFIMSGGDEYTQMQIASSFLNDEPMKIRHKASGTWGDWGDVNIGISSPVAITATAPTDTTALWVDTANMKMKIYKENSWTALT